MEYSAPVFCEDSDIGKDYACMRNSKHVMVN